MFFLYSYHKNKNGEVEFQLFGAYLVEEDGTITISSKYNKYIPSFKMEGHLFWSSCDGQIYLRDSNQNHVLWNPTTHGYKILPSSKRTPPVALLIFIKHGECGMTIYLKITQW